MNKSVEAAVTRRCEPSHRPGPTSGERPWAGRSRGHCLYSSSMSDTAENTVRLREVLAQMPDYKPGKPAAAPGGVTAYKLSSNENPYGPLPSVLAAIDDAAATVNRYPDMAVTQLAGAKPIMVGLDEQARHRLDAMFAAITDRTRVILVCTPNNPTGPCVHQAELEAFLDKVPSDVIVVVDEAYVEFVRDPEAVRGLDVWRHRPNVVVLRTFSKAYGLAGLRVGYAVAHPPVAAALRKTATPFGVNSVAQVAAIASLDAFDELNERVESLVAERDRVVQALSDQGWKLPQSDANFVWFPLGPDSTAFSQACAEAGLTVRQYGDDGVRVTTGAVEANSRLVEVAAAFGAR